MAKPLAFEVNSVAKSAVGSDFNFFLPLSKVEREKDGSCTVSGYASTPALDLDGEIVSLDAIKAALPGYWTWRNIREMHQPSAVGIGKEVNVDSKGLFLTAHITDKIAAQKCVDEVYKGYSIGGRKLAKTGNTITKIDLIEVSLVDRPANPECRINVAKSAKMEGAEAYLVKAGKIKVDPTTKILGKMAEVAEGITEFLTKNNPSAARDGFSLPAKVVEKATLCKAHSIAGCADCTCNAHDVMDCAKCASKVAKKAAKQILKREVKAKERESLASQGNALPDGGFPIKDKGNLANARQAVGRAKNPSAARALIRRRAKELGVELPSKWSKKFAKTLIARKVFEKPLSLDLTKSVAYPSFLDLEPADIGASLADEGSLGAITKRGKDGTSGENFLTLNKRMSVAANLSYCFDSIRNAQRDLICEGEREGWDQKDLALAKTLGQVAKDLAAVISQKASPEGAEALDLTDADDRFLNLTQGEDFAMSENATDLDKLIAWTLNKAGGAKPNPFAQVKDNMKKAKEARKEAAAAIKAAHSMMKAAYLAKEALVKAGKKPKENDNDADDFDMAKAMGHLQKAFSATETMKTFMKAAGEQLKKVGQMEQSPTTGTSDYQVPTGVKTLSQSEMTEGTPPLFPGTNKGAITPREAQLLERAAKAEGMAEALGRLPAGGNTPRAFDVSKLGLTAGNPGDLEKAAVLMTGVNPADLYSTDENVHNQATAKMLGNMILGGKHGKPIFDPDFGGAVGGGRTH